MEKLDRLGWAAGAAVSSYGLRVGVRVTEPGVIHEVLARLPPGCRPLSSSSVDRLYSLVAGGDGPRPGTRRYSLLYGGSARLARSMDLDEVLTAFEADVQMYVAEFARRRLFVHAGVVGWHGRAILIPGRSFSGKSTLVAALVRAGATYYSDEYAVIDGRGRVHPFPRPLALRELPDQPPTRYAVDALGGKAGTEPLPIGLVALTRHRPGARLGPRELSPGEAVLGLLSNTVAARTEPERALRILAKVASTAHVIRGSRGEANEAAELILTKYAPNGRVAETIPATLVPSAGATPRVEDRRNGSIPRTSRAGGGGQ
jgi:hypothetical protein